MVVLDTDHLTILERKESAASQVLQARLDRLDPGSQATTIVTDEEQTRGWMAYMARAKTIPQQIEAYAKLKTHLRSFRNILVLNFDERAGVEYQRLRRSRIRIGTMDLKIAAIVLANDATLLSKNLSDFRKVPGLDVADWTLSVEGSAS
jgi:tRNA(fMet)-specific endonuclease VapC